MRGSPNSLVVTILLNSVGFMLVMAAIILLLRGLGLIGQIPSFVIWSMVLLALGLGILGGIRSLR